MLDGWRTNPFQVYSLENCRFSLGTEGGYFFRSKPSLIAAIISASNAMMSCVLIGRTPFLSWRIGPTPCLHTYYIMYIHICQYLFCLNKNPGTVGSGVCFFPSSNVPNYSAQSFYAPICLQSLTLTNNLSKLRSPPGSRGIALTTATYQNKSLCVPVLVR